MEPTAIDASTAELLYAAVHDLKGPANRLRLLVQLLGRNTAAMDEDTRQLVAHIENSAAAVGTVADGLRNYAEIFRRPVSRVPVDLNQALAAALTNVRAEVEGAGGRVTSSTLPLVEADLYLMTWLFQELLTNAVRFRSEDAPVVHVSGGTGAGSWFVSVADNGLGIPANLAERAFRPFKKLSGGAGAGLGLAICRKIVELHGGRIWLEPREIGADVRFSAGAAA